MTDQPYDPFAADYHWLYSDRVLPGDSFLEEYDEFLAALPKTAKILDCACGIGQHALALAQHGFSAQGTDASAGMVTQARKRAQEAGVEIDFAVCDWCSLPEHFNASFDVVLCLGNSIGHCADKADMVAAFHGIRRVLGDGGSLVLDSRNWMKIRSTRPRFTTLGMREREGIRCIPLYVWNIPEDATQKHLIEVVLQFEEQGKISLRHYAIPYHPFSYNEIISNLAEAGFEIVRSTYQDDDPSYQLIAQKS